MDNYLALENDLVNYLPARVNPRLAAQGEEMRFQRGIRATPWFSEFVKQYGEEPDLSTSADYDYRQAWKMGIRPERDPYDSNRFHWASSTPDGTMLKSKTHPTAWKEEYMRATGNNPRRYRWAVALLTLHS